MSDSTRPAGVRPAWTVGVVFGVLAAIVVAVLPVDSLAQTWTYSSVAIATLVPFGWAVARMDRAARTIWLPLLVAQALYVVGDLVYDLQQFVLEEEPFPGWADPFYLACSLAQAVALAVLIRRRTPGHDREAWIDAAIMSLAAVTVVGAFLIVPMLSAAPESVPAAVIASAYPVLDVVILSGLIRVLVSGGRLHVPLVLLVVGMGLMLTADLAFNLLALGEVEEPGWLDSCYLLAMVALAAAAARPDADVITAPVPRQRGRVSRTRLAGLIIGVLTAPVALSALLWTGGWGPARLLAVSTVLAILLVLWRVLLLFDTINEQARLLARQARTDPLTGLPNRRSWDAELARAARRAATDTDPLCVAMCDLDHFKSFNDVHGHPEGDVLLSGCASAWQDALGPGPVLARYGGEEFAVLLPGLTLEAAARLLDRVRQATPRGQTVSIGVAEWDGSEGIEQAVDRADRALYAAKSTGRDRVVSHDGTRTRWAAATARPLSGQLAGLFQPIVAVDTGVAVSYEAQARLPGLGPDDSRSAAWRAGFGPDLEAAALAAALGSYRDGFPIHVIVSERALAHADVLTALPVDLGGVLLALPADRLPLPGSSDARRLADLRHRGARIALDYRGGVAPGPEELAALRPDLVRCDVELLRVPGDDVSGSRGARALLDAARLAGVALCATGVHTAPDRDLVRDMGIELAQGDYFTRSASTEVADAMRLP